MAAKRRRSPMWTCPECGREFANRNQTHTCGTQPLATHFAGKERRARELFDALHAMFRACGPVEVLAEKTRIAFHVRMSFAAVSVRRAYLVGHLVLARRVEDERFTRIESFSPRNHLHAFRLDDVSQLDAGFEAFAREAYAVGEQRHLDTPLRAKRGRG